MSRDRLRRWWGSARYLIVELGAGFGSLMFVVLGLALLPLVVLSGGWLVVPLLVRPLRSWAGRARVRNGFSFGGVVESAYSEIPARLTIGESLRVAFSRTTGRDLLWLLGHGLLVPIVNLAMLLAPLLAVNALLVPAYWYLAPANDPVIVFYPVTSWAAAAWMPLIALGCAVIAWWGVPGVAFMLRRSQAKVLTPGHKATLTERVTALTASRAAALDAHGSSCAVSSATCTTERRTGW